MTITYLRTPGMAEVNPNIKVIQNFGWISIFVGAEPNPMTSKIVRGEHIAISGEDKDIKAYLNQFDEYWLGVGTPMMQDFQLIKKADQN